MSVEDIENIGDARERIINAGSISGILTTPFAGAYCASKAALHALSDGIHRGHP